MANVNIIKFEVNKRTNAETPTLIAFTIKELERRKEIEIVREKKGFNLSIHIRYKNNAGHTNGCGCPYCQSLHRYVEAKLFKHRLIRRYDNPDYGYGPYAVIAKSEKEFYTGLENIETKIKTLKIIKDSLKAELGITKNM